MAQPNKSTEYHVDSFIDMQKDLSNYLKESHLIDGEWTIAEKKRFINKGCVAVASITLTTHGRIDFEVTATQADPIRQLTVPDKIIQPQRLFINGNEYMELQMDEFITKYAGFLNTTTGVTSATSSTSLPQIEIQNRFYWWNKGENTFDINPPITEATNISLFGVLMPKFLEDDGDIPNLDPSFSYLAPVWAAMMMLDRDEEHKERGAKAESRWDKGMDAFERFKNRRASNRVLHIQKDPGTFSNRTSLNIGSVDYGDNFDRFP